MGWDGMGCIHRYMGHTWNGHEKQILKGIKRNCRLFAPAQDMEVHMISHQVKKAPLLTSPVSLGGFW